jgi:diacylglycerol kinase
MDMITRERHPQVKIIKDLAAGAVLIAAITAVVAGAIIFIPKFL